MWHEQTGIDQASWEGDLGRPGVGMRPGWPASHGREHPGARENSLLSAHPQHAVHQHRGGHLASSVTEDKTWLPLKKRSGASLWDVVPKCLIVQRLCIVASTQKKV